MMTERRRLWIPSLQLGLLMCLVLLAGCSTFRLMTIPSQTDEPDPLVNRPPTASAGFDAIAPVGTMLWVDGSDSSDPDGDELTYTWTYADGSYTMPHPHNPEFFWFEAHQPGYYAFELTVSDGEFTSDRSYVLVYARDLSERPELLTAIVSVYGIDPDAEESFRYRIHGHDGANLYFDFTTLGGNTVNIQGVPGEWEFTVSQAGYVTTTVQETLTGPDGSYRGVRVTLLPVQ